MVNPIIKKLEDKLKDKTLSEELKETIRVKVNTLKGNKTITK